MSINEIKITNLNTNVTRILTYAQNGKIECDNGVLSYKYVKGTSSLYRQVVFKDGTFRQYDADGNQIGDVYNKPDYNFQNLLNKTKSGGSLTIHFFHGIFRIYGPYRIYSNTVLRAPQKDVIFEKMNDIYMFINTDDEEAKTYDFNKGLYAGDGNITIEKIDFDMNELNPQIGKMIHAANINILDCTIRNGRYNSHVFEFACLKNVKVQRCISKDLTIGIGGIKTGRHEILQIESALKGGFPYCLYSKYHYAYRCDSILIDSCKFNNILRGIGNHATSDHKDNYQSNIRVNKCTFDNVIEYDIHFDDKTVVKITS